MKSNNECQYCKLNNNNNNLIIDSVRMNTSKKQSNLTIGPINFICECNSEYNSTHETTYESFLDNLIKHLVQVCNTDQYNGIKSKNNYLICKSCKKIKLIENNIDHIYSAISYNNIHDFESNQAIINFQDLLKKQKEKQLNILNELSKMLKGCSNNELINNNNNNNNNKQDKKNYSSLSSLTSSSLSRFNFSKVFHSLSSFELKKAIKKLDSNKSSSNQNISNSKDKICFDSTENGN